jgi:hypothetical protein
MARYEIQLSNGNSFAYGYDKPFMEYFFQYVDGAQNLIREDSGQASVLLQEIELLGQKMFPMNHIMDIAMDMPIRDMQAGNA